MPGRYAVLLERYIAVLPFWSTFGMVPGLINTFKFFLFSSPFDSFFFLPASHLFICAFLLLSLSARFLPLRRYTTLWRRLNRFFSPPFSTRRTRHIRRDFVSPCQNWPFSITLPPTVYHLPTAHGALNKSKKRKKKSTSRYSDPGAVGRSVADQLQPPTISDSRPSVSVAICPLARTHKFFNLFHLRSFFVKGKSPGFVQLSHLN
jgi:hypothetical protein